jgi:hypothetical protein
VRVTRAAGVCLSATAASAARTTATVSAGRDAPGPPRSAATLAGASNASRPATAPTPTPGSAGPAPVSTTRASRRSPTTAPTRATPVRDRRFAAAAHAPVVAPQVTVRRPLAVPRHAHRGFANDSATTTCTASAELTQGFVRNAAATTTSVPSSTEPASMGSASARARTSRDVAWNASTSASSRTTVAPATAYARVGDASTASAPTLNRVDSSATPYTIQIASRHPALATRSALASPTAFVHARGAWSIATATDSARVVGAAA